MANVKPKCSQCNERDVFSKGLCSGCYGRKWRAERKAERDAAIAAEFPPKLLTGDVVEGELVIEGEVIAEPRVPETHLTALNPMEMQAAREEMKPWLEAKLEVIERDIREANAALNEARKNGWNTSALTSLRNRAVDDETYYNKILAAVEAGYTLIPDFPISVFAVRTEGDWGRQLGWQGHVDARETVLGNAAEPDCAPAGAGDYRNPQPEVTTWRGVKYKNEKGTEIFPFFARRTGRPVGPISFPSMTARSPIMRATAEAMKEKTFDQVGVCHPVVAAQASRQVQTNSARAGDPLVIGQILRKKLGSRQKCVSFIIAWHLNLNDL